MSSTILLAVSWISLCCCFPLFKAHKMQTNPYKKTIPYYPAQGKAMNVIDSCWRSNPDWAENRQKLADCAKGFGNGALGGKNGAIYVVTDNSDHPINPKPGTLRYGVIQNEPLWIIFQRNMVIKLENELIVNSYKTIDGRGAKVEIANGPCVTIESVSNVIIHGISIHDCKPGKPGMVRSSPQHVGRRLGSDGDAITVFASSNVWIDHCYLARCTDGLVDIIHASTSVTVSNNYFTQHDKVMLLGHQDGYTADKVMKVTVAFNHFGPGLVERMPRVRYGYAHVANNMYERWLMYAIGGSSNPTILSEGNYFLASDNPVDKQVTKRETNGSGGAGGIWKNWKWRTSKDVFMNGAFFVQSGMGSCSPLYTVSQSFPVASGLFVPSLTSDAAPLFCVPGKPC